MKKEENSTQDVQMEAYEAPRMEVIEMEIEGPILGDSGATGENGNWGPWN